MLFLGYSISIRQLKKIGKYNSLLRTVIATATVGHSSFVFARHAKTDMENKRKHIKSHMVHECGCTAAWSNRNCGWW